MFLGLKQPSKCVTSYVKYHDMEIFSSMQHHSWTEKRLILEALTTLTAVLTVSLYSSALSVLWNDSKRAIHHLPKTSCREGNDEAKKKPRDTQVESPIE